MTSPTTPRDAIGLSERLERALAKAGPEWAYSPLVKEAATQLDALQERVKELGAEQEPLVREVQRVNSQLADEMQRATRAEQERDEAQRDAERYRFLRGRDLDTIHKGGVFAGMTPQNIILNEDDLDREVDAAIRSLASDGEERK